nr:hypothetical protein [Kibdelosporangium sp. MJ126-NF4]
MIMARSATRPWQSIVANPYSEVLDRVRGGPIGRGSGSRAAAVLGMTGRVVGRTTGEMAEPVTTTTAMGGT